MARWIEREARKMGRRSRVDMALEPELRHCEPPAPRPPRREPSNPMDALEDLKPYGDGRARKLNGLWRSNLIAKGLLKRVYEDGQYVADQLTDAGRAALERGRITA